MVFNFLSRDVSKVSISIMWRIVAEADSDVMKQSVEYTKTIGEEKEVIERKLESVAAS